MWFGYENGQQTTIDRKTFTDTEDSTTAQWQRYQNTINPWGLTTAITVSKSSDGTTWSSGRTLVENTYENGYGNIIKKEMANGQYVEYFYDLLDRPTKVVYYNNDDTVQATYCYVYNSQGQLSQQYAVDSIVEQCQAKASRTGFSVSWIQNALNVISLPYNIHQQVSNFYSSIPGQTLVNTGGMVFRDWLNSMSFAQQYEWGIWVLRLFGVEV